jgi:hypothetical protein
LSSSTITTLIRRSLFFPCSAMLQHSFPWSILSQIFYRMLWLAAVARFFWSSTTIWELMSITSFNIYIFFSSGLDFLNWSCF